jgi:hypothetical protein
LRNGVVAEDHFKFGKKCPFHPQYAKPESGSRVPRENEEKDTKEDAAKREAREDVAVAVASAPPSAAPEIETPPKTGSFELDERPTGTVPPACGFRTAAVAVSSAAVGGQAPVAGESTRGEA